jgi:hypothetical protein
VSFLQKKIGWRLAVDFFDFPLFLRGVLGNVVRRRRFFDGKNTVKCTANTDKKIPLFAA